MHPQHNKQFVSNIPACIFLVAFGLLLLGVIYWLRPSDPSAEAVILRTPGQLRIGVLNQRTRPDQLSRHISTRLIEQLAKRYDWEVHYQVYTSQRELFNSLQTRKVDLLADMVIDQPQLPIDVRFSHSYDQGTPVVVYFSGISPAKESFDQLFDNQLLVVDKSWQDRLLIREQLVYTDLYWQKLPDYFDINDLIESLASPPGGYSLLLEREMEVLRFTNKKTRSMLSLDPVDLGLMFRGEDQRLEELISRFIDSWLEQQPRSSTSYTRPYLSRIDLQTFLSKVETRLPKYMDLFVEAGREFQVDWRLIAAVSYQESHWNPRAVSPTGVRGLMMLTESTASSLGVTRRTNPKQSVYGGTKYFLLLRDKLPSRIAEPDRSWLALAAYNVGMAHVKDIRMATARRGGNPDLWQDVRANLPLLQNPKWYRTSRYGFGRGIQARTYVDNIQKYFEVLLHLLEQQPYKPLPDEATRATSVVHVETPRQLLPPAISRRY